MTTQKTNTSRGAIHGPTLIEKRSIVKHAKEIYTRICLVEPVTDKNTRGHHTKAEMALNLAELFHEYLLTKGYENE